LVQLIYLTKIHKEKNDIKKKEFYVCFLDTKLLFAAASTSTSSSFVFFALPGDAPVSA